MKGDSVSVGGKRYVVTDPTYVNAVSGMTMLTLIVTGVVLLKLGISGGEGMFVTMMVGGVVCTALAASGALAHTLFLNDAGLVDAGRHRNDSVIGPSWAVPRRSGGTPFVRTGL